LMKYFNFDEADLAANKMGQLSDKQQKRHRDDAGAYATGTGCGLFFFGLAAIFPVLCFGKCLPQGNCQITGLEGNEAWLVMGMIIFMNLVWVGALGGVGVWIVKGTFSKKNWQFKQAQGPIKIVEELSSDSHHHEIVEYELHVGGQVFDVDASLADIMMQGDEYVFYYLVDLNFKDDPGEVLSVERA
jgi:hypothetical protein